ncbi:hypothetical protein J2X45_003406 [Caulobacter sp. BE264]|uniref:DUF6950 family protein n=1 Tax=Caulobacter sp. BE264 TaxID=2817724 RepID=UPI00285E613B|nr:hypothetical protein [Caulobacter sp. BE264]MDR7232300.1 hypothetical protein [Caulobacter sp. BE264]
MRDDLALVAFLAARMRAPFAWGREANDCVSFAAAAALVQTGRDVLPADVTWRSARGAGRVLRRLGGLEAAVDAQLPTIAPAKARRGDVALVETRTGPALMIFEGAALVGPGPTGLMRRPRADARKAWSLD